MDVMEFVGVGSDGQLWSTVRDSDGNWQGAFDNPPGGTGAPEFQDVDSAGVGNGVFQLVAIGRDGKLYHALRDANGDWEEGVAPIAGIAEGPPSFTGVGTAGDGDGGLNVVAVGSDGQLWHTARENNGTWFATFDAVARHSAGGPGRYAAVAAAGSGGPTQLVAIGSDGHLWHTIRNPDDQWQGNMGDVRQASAGGPPRFTRVACSGDSDGGLNIVALGSDGQLWHTARHSDGTWLAQFDQVSTDSPGAPGGIVSVGAGNDSNDDMQVVAVGPDGTLWHTIRHGPGNWQLHTFRVPSAGGPARFTRISTGSGALAEIAVPRYANPVPVPLQRAHGTIGPWTGSLLASAVPPTAVTTGVTLHEDTGVSATLANLTLNGSLHSFVVTGQDTTTADFNTLSPTGSWSLTVTGTGVTDTGFSLDVSWGAA